MAGGKIRDISHKLAASDTGADTHTYINSQYFNYYTSRIRDLKLRLQAKVSQKWEDIEEVDVMEVQHGVDQVVIGMLCRIYKARDSVIQRYIIKLGQLDERKSVYANMFSQDDECFIEDLTGRVKVDIKALGEKADSLVQGVVAAFRGSPNENGLFVVTDFCFAGIQPVDRPMSIPDEYICFVSGLEIGSGEYPLMVLHLFGEYLQDALNQESLEEAEKIVQLVILGDSMHKPVSQQVIKRSGLEDMNFDEIQHMTEGIKELDTFLAELLGNIPISILPGASDPNNIGWPQEAFNPILFPQAFKYSSFNLHQNPTTLNIDEMAFLCTSGQNIDSLLQYSKIQSPQEAMKYTLKYNHLAPTVPDCMPGLPHQEDPLILDYPPHAYIIGNQAEFFTGDYKGIKLIGVPKFCHPPHTVVLVNRNTLEAKEISFSIQLQQQSSPNMEGYLSKWTNAVTRWKKRWFKIQDGVLIYGKNPGKKPKGMLPLNLVKISQGQKKRTFTITDGVQTLHLRGYTNEETIQWQQAIRKFSGESANMRRTMMVESPHITSQQLTQRFQKPENEDTVTFVGNQLESLSNIVKEMIEFIDGKDSTTFSGLYYEFRNTTIDILSALESERNKAKKAESMLQVRAQTFGVSPDNFAKQLQEEIDYSDDDNENIDDLFYDTRQYSFHQVKATQGYRSCLPIQKDPNQKINVWKVIKDSIGKDLSKIAVPVYFNEPLSFIQRLSEDLAFHDILVRANACSDPTLRCAYVACFIISTYALSQNRTLKPFNPILGETFELERDELRIIAEQVSHHPPISAIHCEHPDFYYWGSTEVKNKFKATYLSIEPKGNYHVYLPKWGDKYHMHKPLTNVHNLIIGKVYLDHHGNLNVHNQNTGDTASCLLHKRGWFDKRVHEVEGEVYSGDGVLKYRISGKWSQSLKITDVNTDQEFVAYEVHFQEGYEYNYFFSEFALQLNMEPQEGIAPTDSRFRQDQRALENGDLPLATSEKHRLEEKQRAARRQLEQSGQEYSPRWFRLNGEDWEYTGGYWEAKSAGDWEGLPDLFSP